MLDYHYHCEHCDGIFSYDDCKFEKEDWGLDLVCPKCGGQLENAFYCTECCTWFPEDKVTNGVCDDCVFEIKNDVESCYKMSRKEDWTATVEIDRLLAMLFTDEEINDILYRELLSSGKTYDCTDFLKELHYEVAEYMQKERRLENERRKAKKDSTRSCEADSGRSEEA